MRLFATGRAYEPAFLAGAKLSVCTSEDVFSDGHHNSVASGLCCTKNLSTETNLNLIL